MATIKIVARDGKRVSPPVIIRCPGCAREFAGPWGRTERVWAKHFTRTHYQAPQTSEPPTQGSAA